MVDDADVAYQEYKDHKERSQSAPQKVAKSLTPKQVVIFVVLLLGIYWAVWVKQEPMFTKSTGYTMIAALVVIGYLIVGKSAESIDYLDIDVVQRIALTDARRQQVLGTLPEGHIDLLPEYNLQRVEGDPVMWYVAISIKSTSRSISKYLMKVDPYNGKPNGFIDKPQGILLKEYQDIRFIRTKKDRFEDKYGD